jgi:hypothetical protein
VESAVDRWGETPVSRVSNLWKLLWTIHRFVRHTRF